MRRSLKPLAAALLLSSAASSASVVDYVANPPLRGEEHRGALLDMKNCLASKTCPEPEKKLTRKLLALLDPPPTTNDGVKKMVAGLSPIFREAVKLHPEAFVEQIQLLSGGLLLAGTMDTFQLPAESSKGLRQFVLEESRGLTVRFPKDARAFGMLGRAQQESGAGELDALRSYVHCLKLDPQENLCRQWYRKVTGAMSAPRCSSAQLAPGFRIQGGAHARRAPTDSELSFQDRKIFVSPRPVIGKADVKRLILEEMAGPMVELEPSGVRKLAEIASRGRDELAVVQVGGRILNAMTIYGPISGSRMQIIWPTAQNEAQARESFARLCSKVQVPAIPPELRIKL
jgi:hypothetical protein